MKLQLGLTAISFVVFIAPVNAQDVKLTLQFKQCIERSGAVDPEMLKCISEEYVRQDKRLNQTYKSALQRLSPGQKTRMQEAQRLWLKFTTANCDFYYDPDGGTAARLAANQCAVDARATRAEELEMVIESLPE